LRRNDKGINESVFSTEEAKAVLKALSSGRHTRTEVRVDAGDNAGRIELPLSND